MPKPSAYSGKRLRPLLAAGAQAASEAGQAAEDASTEAGEKAPLAHTHAQSDVTDLTTDLSAIWDAVGLKADDSMVVHDVGNEGISGVKTFSDDIKVAPEDKGLVLIDRTTDAEFRLYVDGGVLLIEAV